MCECESVCEGVCACVHVCVQRHIRVVASASTKAGLVHSISLI